MCLASPTKGKKGKKKFFIKRFLKATNLFAGHKLQLIKLKVNQKYHSYDKHYM